MGNSSSIINNIEQNNNILIRQNGSLYLNVNYTPTYLPVAQKISSGILIKPQLKSGKGNKKMVRFILGEASINY
jgi:hypothetical protein